MIAQHSFHGLPGLARGLAFLGRCTVCTSSTCSDGVRLCGFFESQQNGPWSGGVRVRAGCQRGRRSRECFRRRASPRTDLAVEPSAAIDARFLVRDSVHGVQRGKRARGGVKDRFLPFVVGTLGRRSSARCRCGGPGFEAGTAGERQRDGNRACDSACGLVPSTRVCPVQARREAPGDRDQLPGSGR
jgi:hypothetical protein